MKKRHSGTHMKIHKKKLPVTQYSTRKRRLIWKGHKSKIQEKGKYKMRAKMHMQKIQRRVTQKNCCAGK